MQCKLWAGYDTLLSPLQLPNQVLYASTHDSDIEDETLSAANMLVVLHKLTKREPLEGTAIARAMPDEQRMRIATWYVKELAKGGIGNGFDDSKLFMVLNLVDRLADACLWSASR